MNADPLGEAARWVEGGGLLAYPTETVWGLGADAASQHALARLCRWKGRAGDAPISVLVENADAARALGCELGAAALRLVEAFWPGPLTLVVRCQAKLAPGVARADGAVGLRCSAHPLAAALARRLRSEGVGPITATSLNPSGAPPARTRAEARARCGRREDEPRLLDVGGAEAGGGPESTVVDTTGAKARVLRYGAYVEDEIAEALAGLAS